MLIVLVIFMMMQIGNLQGTARVVNYAGLVRGATQREVKLEITGNQDDDLIQYLDDILSGLKYEDGHYNLVSLHEILIIKQTVSAMRMAKKNKVLEQKAYIDLHTGLPNKSRCEELLHNVEFIKEPTACIMFDLNNLKVANDTMGHSVGDQLIMNFARLLRCVIPAKDFVGRFGGDEFIAVVYDTDKQKVEQILENLRSEIDQFNSYGKHVPISYAQGWVLSTDYTDCTLQTLFDKADHYMYENKQREKVAGKSAE